MTTRFAALPVLAAVLAALGGNARAADKEAEEQFARLIHDAVVAKMPKQYEDQSGWGKTVPIMDGVKLANLRTKVKVGDHEEWPDGGWNRAVFRVDDPDKDVVIKVRDVWPSDHKTTLMTVEVTVKGHMEEERQQWQQGLKLLAFTAEANAVVVLTLDVDAAITFDLSKAPPQLVVKPKVTKSQIDLKEFDLVRVGKLQGDKAKAVGDEMKGGLQKAAKLAEPYATERINEAIVKALTDKNNKGPISAEKLLKDK